LCVRKETAVIVLKIVGAIMQNYLCWIYAPVSYGLYFEISVAAVGMCKQHSCILNFATKYEALPHKSVTVLKIVL
jgi:hypothetical protein